MIPTRRDNASVPITVEEIVADAHRCWNAGATVVHVHARDEHEAPSYRADIYGEIIARIREECPDLLLSASTSGRVHRELGQRSDVLTLEPPCRPDFGSLTLGSMNFPNSASINEPATIRSLAHIMRERHIIPEWEIFDVGMADYARYLVEKDVLTRPYYANILLGSLGTLSATPENLLAVVRALPAGTVWSATGIGRFQFSINRLAVVVGGHVRVGLEDSLYYDAEKTRPATNAGLVDRIVRLAGAAEREIASPADARRILGLPRVELANL